VSESTVVIPEGHRLRLISLSPQSLLARADSGVWIADTGADRSGEQILARVAQLLGADPRAQVVFIVQPSALAPELVHPRALAAWLRGLFGLRAHAPGAPQVVVVPQAAPGGRQLAALIASLGLSVLDVGPDNTVLVEVCRPDGTVPGFTGRPLPADGQRALAAIFEQQGPAPGADEAAVAFVARHIPPPPPPDPARMAQLSLAALVTLAGDIPDDAYLPAFIAALLESEVGGRHQGAPGERPQLPVAKVAGFPMLVALCDLPAMARAFPHEQFFGLGGRDLLELAHSQGYGVLVCNELDLRRPRFALSPDQVAWIAGVERSAQARPGLGWEQERQRHLLRGPGRLLHEPGPVVIARRSVPLLLLGLLVAAVAALLLAIAAGLSAATLLIFRLMLAAGVGIVGWAAVQLGRDIARLRAFKAARARYGRGA